MVPIRAPFSGPKIGKNRQKSGKSGIFGILADFGHFWPKLAILAILAIFGGLGPPRVKMAKIPEM